MEESLDDLYEHAPCGYLSTDFEGVIVKVNETFLAMTGFERSDVLGRTWLSLLSGGARIFHETHYAPLLRMQGYVREIAIDMVCADGARLPVLVNSVLHHDRKVVRTVVFSASDRREYERELLRERERAIASEAKARLLAQTLQQSFIPPALPEVPGLDVAGVYRPAGTGDEVGGDFYDVFSTGSDGAWVVVVGDVQGKGAEAAAVTAMARYTLRAAAMQSSSPGVVLRTLHDMLTNSEFDRFVTVVYARIADGAMTVSSGGHPCPLRVTPAGEVTPICQVGSLVGVLGLELPPSDALVPLRPGEVFVFYTDGVTEARNATEGFFGEERLQALVGSCSGLDAAGIADRVVDAVVTYQEGLPRDDIAVVVVKVAES